MPNYDTLTEEWLAEVLAELGETRDEVAETLRKAEIKGRRCDPYDCPVTRYVTSRVMEHLGPSDHATVASCTFVRIELELAGVGYRMLKLRAPGPVSDFIDAFDSGRHDGAYADLAEAEEPAA